MYHTTGFTRDQVDELCAQVRAANEVTAEPEKVTWPPILGLFKSVVVTLTYLRRNRVQAEIGEAFGVSQPTISRAITAMTPLLLEEALRPFVPTANELDDKTQYVVDGTLLPCWSWASHPQLYSGKHHTGTVRLLGVQCGVACQGRGMVSAVSGSGGCGQTDDVVPGGEACGHLVSVLDCGESVASGSEMR